MICLVAGTTGVFCAAVFCGEVRRRLQSAQTSPAAVSHPIPPLPIARTEEEGDYYLCVKEVTLGGRIGIYKQETSLRRSFARGVGEEMGKGRDRRALERATLLPALTVGVEFISSGRTDYTQAKQSRSL